MNTKAPKVDTQGEVIFAKGAVGKEITTSVPIVTLDASVGEVRDKLADFASKTDSIDYIYVNSLTGQLIGVVSIKELFRHNPAQKIKNIMVKDLVTSHPKTNKERVAHLAIKHNIKAVPVVDSKNRLIGVLSNDQVKSILYNQYRKSFHHFAGIIASEEKYQTILEYGIMRNIISRLPWVLVGLIGGIFAAQVIEFFDTTLSANLVLAIFIPLVVYIGNAVGAQTQTFLVRDLAFSPKLKIVPYFFKQFVSGTLIGAVCGLIIWLVVVLYWKLAFVGMVVGIASFVTISLSTVVAVSIPYLLYKLNQEPASGSGPFATILQDLLSIYIYFLIASILL